MGRMLGCGILAVFAWAGAAWGAPSPRSVPSPAPLAARPDPAAINAEIAARGRGGVLLERTLGRWTLQLRSEGGDPLRMWALVERGDTVRSEIHYYREGTVFAIDAERIRRASGPSDPRPLSRRYSLAGGGCFWWPIDAGSSGDAPVARERKAPGTRAVARPCAPGLATKLLERAMRFREAIAAIDKDRARASLDALEEWPENP